MAASEVSHANLVAKVLAKHWHISDSANQTDLGVSRATWRIGQLYWLSQAEQTRLAELLDDQIEGPLHSSSTSFKGMPPPEPRMASCAKRRSASVALLA